MRYQTMLPLCVLLLAATRVPASCTQDSSAPAPCSVDGGAPTIDASASLLATDGSVTVTGSVLYAGSPLDGGSIEGVVQDVLVANISATSTDFDFRSFSVTIPNATLCSFVTISSSSRGDAGTGGSKHGGSSGTSSSSSSAGANAPTSTLSVSLPVRAYLGVPNGTCAVDGPPVLLLLAADGCLTPVGATSSSSSATSGSASSGTSDAGTGGSGASSSSSGASSSSSASSASSSTTGSSSASSASSSGG